MQRHRAQGPRAEGGARIGPAWRRLPSGGSAAQAACGGATACHAEASGTTWGGIWGVAPCRGTAAGTAGIGTVAGTARAPWDGGWAPAGACGIRTVAGTPEGRSRSTSVGGTSAPSGATSRSRPAYSSAGRAGTVLRRETSSPAMCTLPQRGQRNRARRSVSGRASFCPHSGQKRFSTAPWSPTNAGTYPIPTAARRPGASTSTGGHRRP